MAGQASTQLSFSVSGNIGFWLTVMSKFSSCPFPRCLCCHGYIIISESRDWAFCWTQWYDEDLSKKDLIVLQESGRNERFGDPLFHCFPNSSSRQRVRRQMFLFDILSQFIHLCCSSYSYGSKLGCVTHLVRVVIVPGTHREVPFIKKRNRHLTVNILCLIVESCYTTQRASSQAHLVDFQEEQMYFFTITVKLWAKK